MVERVLVPVSASRGGRVAVYMVATTLVRASVAAVAAVDESEREEINAGSMRAWRLVGEAESEPEAEEDRNAR